MVPSNSGGNSKHKLNTCIMFGPKSSVFTVMKKKKIQAKSCRTAWGSYAELYTYMFNKETVIKAKFTNINVKIW